MKEVLGCIVLLFVLQTVVGITVPPGFKCKCQYSNKVCIAYADIDECRRGHNCGEGTTCVNTIGSYKCNCADGLVKTSKGECIEDVDECELTENKCGTHGTCVNTPGSYDCSCDPGYILSDSEKVCVDEKKESCRLGVGTPNNLLARGKKVTLSSRYHCGGTWCFDGYKAVDGIYKPTGHEYSSIAITKQAPNEWLQIDLEEPHCVSAVKIWNRQDNYQPRFRNVLINVGMTEQEVDTTSTTSDVACTYFPGQPADVQLFDCKSNMYGRYVRVWRLNHPDHLNVYEVEVIGS